MKGATTEPSASIKSPPKINIIIISGASHNFFLTLRKNQSSFKNSIITQFLKLASK